jgi:VWFA-related protein
MSSTRPVFPIFLISLLLVPAIAQQTPSTTLQSGASLVLVDVVVTSKGKPVQGLKESQFRVTENGKTQAITSFEEHKAAVAQDAPPATPLPADTYTDRPDYPESSAVNVLLLDALNTPLGDQMQARQQMLDYLKTLPAGRPIAIFTLASQLRMVQGVSADRNVLSAAMRGPSGNSRPSPVIDTTTDQALDSTVADLSAFGASQQALSAMQQFEADNTAMQTDQRVRLTLQAMQQLARYCSGIPTRKNLIWFSGSFPLSLDADMSLDNPLDATRNYSEEVRETSHLLSAARDARQWDAGLRQGQSQIHETDLGGACVDAAGCDGHRGVGLRRHERPATGCRSHHATWVELLHHWLLNQREANGREISQDSGTS